MQDRNSAIPFFSANLHSLQVHSMCNLKQNNSSTVFWLYGQDNEKLETSYSIKFSKNTLFIWQSLLWTVCYNLTETGLNNVSLVCGL